jgi:hypothetical protein
MLFEETHASAGIGKAPRAVEPAVLETSRGQERIAMVDLRSSYRFVKLVLSRLLVIIVFAKARKGA